MCVKHVSIVFGQTCVNGALLTISSTPNNSVCSSSKWLQPPRHPPESVSVYLIVRKKRGRLLGEEKSALHKNMFDTSRSVFHWYSKRHDFLCRKYFFNPKLIKESSGFHIHYFIISRDKYVDEYYWTLSFVVLLHFW